MLARSDLTDYILDHYGTCARGSGQCYHAKDGCLGREWRGRQCPHWRPVEGDDFARLHAAMNSTLENEPIVK